MTARSKAGRITAIGLTALMALGALPAGVGMMRGGVGIPDTWLAHTPFDSWFLPGLALLTVVAVPQGAALVALTRGHARAASITFAAGALLIGWIVVEVAWMRHFNALQPICLAAGCAEVFTSRHLPRRLTLVTRRPGSF